MISQQQPYPSNLKKRFEDIESLIIKHPNIVALYKELDFLININAGESRLMCVYGDTGTGKTTSLKCYTEIYLQNKPHGGNIIPVVMVDCPTPFREKNLASDILNALGCSPPKNASEWFIRSMLYVELRKRQTMLIIIDEIQHINGKYTGVNPQTIRYLDYIKQISNNVHIPIVLAGMPTCITLIAAHQQLNRRCIKCELLQFKNDEQFHTFLYNVEQGLKLTGTSNLASEGMADIIYEISRGLISEVMQLLRRAATEAILNGTEIITPRLLIECSKWVPLYKKQ